MSNFETMEGMMKQFSMIRKVYGKCLCQTFQKENFSPSEIDALIFLSNNPSVNTSKELCVFLGVSKSLVCRSVEGLMKRGLLEIVEDVKDRRIQRLHLTKAASPYVDSIKEQQGIFSKKILQAVDPHNIEITFTTLKQISDAINEFILKGENES